MTTSLSAAIRTPHRASVAAPAPLAPGASAEPCAAMPAMLPANGPWGRELGGIIAPASESRRGGTDSDRFGAIARRIVGGGWYRQDQARLAGGGPLRG